MVIPFIRPIKEQDLASLNRFTIEAGFGVTTLAKDIHFLREKIIHSIESFQKTIQKPDFESYLFVLETTGEKIVGLSAILSRIGTLEHAYHLLPLHQHSKTLNIDREVPVLHFISARKRPTEIGSLFLEEEYRGKGFGKLLSFSRFLFMAAFKERFKEMVVAEMRGVYDSDGISPFYEAVGHPFLQCTFEEANLLRIAHPETINEIFPPYPIYPWLLPKEAADALGKVHPETEPALKLLQSQGFKISQYRDFLDGGPHLFSEFSEIKIIKESYNSEVRIMNIVSDQIQKAMVANNKLDFRSCLIPCMILDEDTVGISDEAAKTLNVQSGEKVRIVYV